MGVALLVVTLFVTFMLGQWQNRITHFTNEALAEEPEPKEVQLKIKIDWTEERIIEEIKSTFPEEPELAVKVAKCESHFNPNAVNYNNPNGSIDRGVMQLNSVHDNRLNSLGLDPFDPIDNLTFARMLYDESGWRPWVCYTHNLI